MHRAAWLLALAASAAQAADWIGPVDDRYGARRLERLLAENPLKKDENIRAVPIARSALSAQVLVQVREREPLHYHADSDLTVLIVRGRGRLRIGEQELPARAGDVLYIPRGAVHAYINDGPEVGAALVIYSPPPGPDDRVLVEPGK
jgi:mannose-6-phosphate isomerase-like protein (cupin superfamily)